MRHVQRGVGDHRAARIAELFLQLEQFAADHRQQPHFRTEDVEVIENGLDQFLKFRMNLVLLQPGQAVQTQIEDGLRLRRSEEHTSELQSLMRISYAVFCLKKKKTQ